MPAYERAWKLFRRLSNENDVTAEHLLSRALWPRQSDVTLLDIGCGDGLLTQRLVLLSPEPVAEVRLLDPDAEFLAQAQRHIAETGIVGNLQAHLGRAETTFRQHCAGAAVVLAVHVVYLMADDALEQLIAALPFHVPMYVVVDSPESVFARLWRRTAPKYSSRSTAAHGAIHDLPRDVFQVNVSTISSRLENPLSQPQEMIKEGLLSLLSYADVHSMTAADRRWVEQQVHRYVIGEHVHCDSCCYEIAKTSIVRDINAHI